jgi:hypothetical protein
VSDAKPTLRRTNRFNRCHAARTALLPAACLLEMVFARRAEAVVNSGNRQVIAGTARLSLLMASESFLAPLDDVTRMLEAVRRKDTTARRNRIK